jgi:hypothetical protein
MTGQRCPWPGCQVTAKPGRLMCYGHWTRLPKRLRAPIWEHYKPGQNLATASPEYVDALLEVLEYARRVTAEAERQAAVEAEMQSTQESLW